MENPRYKYYKELYPDWSEEQIWTAISLDMKTKDVVVNQGGNISIEDNVIMREIIRGASEWLEAVLPDIFEKVKDFFIVLLDKIKDWVQAKFADILRLIGEYF